MPAQGNATARREGGHVFGVGTTDMKSGDAVMLALAESLDLSALRFDLALVFYDGEEGPAAGNGLGRVLADMPWLAQASLAVLLEPTDLQVELGCNGVLNVEVRVPGRSAHSARPWMGVNAVAEGAAWLAEITKFPVTPVDVQGIEYRETRSLEESMPELDILYMTRVQKERFFNEEDYIRLKNSYILTSEKMALAKPEMAVLHPLPRVNEIALDVDNDPRAAYFEQVQNGVYIRMALIMTLLGLADPKAPKEGN